MLIQAIHTLDMEPSRKTGEFYQKVIAITDIKKRILFVNRGQAWVVRRLEALIPKVGQSDIKKGLEEMLEAHKNNIHKVEIALQ
jgi:nitronate monooxygenase